MNYWLNYKFQCIFSQQCVIAVILYIEDLYIYLQRLACMHDYNINIILTVMFVCFWILLSSQSMLDIVSFGYRAFYIILWRKLNMHAVLTTSLLKIKLYTYQYVSQTLTSGVCRRAINFSSYWQRVWPAQYTSNY